MFPKTQELSCNIFSGKQLYEVDDQAFALMLNRLKVGQGIVGWVAQTNELLIVRDVREDSRFLATADVYPNVEVRSVVAVPLRSQESSCVGVLELINVVGPGGFPETDISLLQTFADFAAIGFGNQDTCASAAELGRFDGLTGFETKPYFETALRVRFKYIKRRFSLINIQLEDFETLSESESWQLINQLLVEVTRTIKANIRGFDSAFRYDSAEFFIDLVNATKENACNMALQLHGALKRTVSLVTGLEDPHVAMGVATYPSDFETKEDMFQRFDEAMLLLKISTGDGVVAVGKGILSPPTHCCDSDGGRR
jgi:diguanylate cyclase (GGDEF)-like protein